MLFSVVNSQCSTGYYLQNGDPDDPDCESCSAGEVSAGDATLSCTSCTGSTIPSVDRSSCILCPVNYACSSYGVQTACSASEYSQLGSLTCSSCTTGEYLDTSDSDYPTCESCGDTEISAGGATTTCSSCSTGSYPDSTKAYCILCPVNVECSSTGEIGSCPANTFSALGDDTCSSCSSAQYVDWTDSNYPVCASCAAGSVSTGGSVSSCTVCSGGQVPNTARTACIDCPLNYSCTTMGVQTACAAGSFSALGSTTCTSCSTGEFMSTSSGSNYPACASCPLATVSTGGSITTCTTCSGTYVPNSDLSACELCPSGYECLPTDSPTRYLCSAGYFSTTGDLDCVSCPDGYYSSAGASVCTICPAGMACSTTGVTASCSSGQYSPLGAATCSDCPIGHTCVDPSQPLPCSEGTYPAADSLSCTTCPADSYCPAYVAAPITCLSGYTSVAGSTSCRLIVAGETCTLSSEGSTTCDLTTCPDGYACDASFASLSRLCPRGTESINGAYTCTACTAGYMCNPPDRTICPAGQYSLSGSTSCDTCPPGYYCETDGTSAPELCPDGTYAPAGSTACLTCSDGYYCLNGVALANPVNLRCPLGSQCTDGLATICTAGTYSMTRGSTSCTTCPAGYSCPEETSDYNNYPCPRGFYCPAGTTSPTECPLGTFKPDYGGKSVSDCLDCPKGYYCPANSIFPSLCPAGNYCPAASGTFQSCPAGTYLPNQGGTALTASSSSDMACLTCPPGYICGISSEVPQPCPPGTYNPFSGASEPPACLPCQAGFSCPFFGSIRTNLRPCSPGYFCPAGTAWPDSHPCPPGTFSDSFLLSSPQQCTLCLPGYACAEGSEGLGSPRESKRPLACAAGHYCPLGSSTPYERPCPSGYTSSLTGLSSESDCSPCGAGSFCDAGDDGTSVATDYACTPGYYCPAGSTSTTQFACPLGTYSASTSAKSAGDCTPCPPGNYCNRAATAATPCPEGTYSSYLRTQFAGPGSAFPACISCPGGYICAAGTSIPSACPAGEYSDVESSACTACPPGSWCGRGTAYANLLTSNLCSAGRLCSSSSIAVNPDSDGSLPCPAGSYCPAGATTATPCSAGFYSPIPGAGSVDDCKTMASGMYSTEGWASATGLACDPGYYCPEGSGSSTQVACPPRTYRTLEGAGEVSDCAACPKGYYCGSATVTPTICPAGSYCVAGVEDPQPCPKGTYGPTTGLSASYECTSCTAGSYCDRQGLTSPTGLCAAGFVCYGGATYIAPRDGITGDLCPAGGYCPEGSSSATPCTAGYYIPTDGAKSDSSCIPCAAGKYCQGTSHISGDCDAGYYCTGGSDNAQQLQTPSGYFSLSGAAIPTPCAPGSYQPLAGQSSCVSCDAGYYCSGQALTAATACPVGHYCTLGAVAPLPCPAGSYSASTLTASSTCTPCPSSSYCREPGLSAVSGTCLPGYRCILGAYLPAPMVDETGVQGPCPAGYYCPLGVAIPCPAGTYNPSTEGVSLSSSCLTCPAGYYCQTSGLSSPTAACPAGYFCAEGSTSGSANLCTIGNQCSLGSSEASPCLPGSYAGSGADSCTSCAAGAYCELGATSSGSQCPVGHYCPSSTKISDQWKCPPGTYNSFTGATSWTGCTACDGGRYCSEAGASGPSGECAAGYYCSQYSITDKPSGEDYQCLSGVSGRYSSTCTSTTSYSDSQTAIDDCINNDDCLGVFRDGLNLFYQGCSSFSQQISTGDIAYPKVSISGGLCAPGTYCALGSSTPVSCDAGKYCDQYGLSEPSGDCSGGYICLGGAITATPSDSICPVGYYCPAGAVLAVACSAGTYLPTEGNADSSACLTCPPGYYCQTDGLGEVSGSCQTGFYCPAGSTSSVNTPCPSGYYCLEGSAAPTPCPPGSYQSDSSQSSCNTCPAGYYCPYGGTVVTVSCPAGFYCGESTSIPSECPIGTYNPASNSVSSDACISCLAGHYCASSGLSEPTALCPAGYFCSSGQSNPQENKCPIGSICPEGSTTASDCPAGFFCSQAGRGIPTGRCLNGWDCSSSDSDRSLPIGTDCGGSAAVECAKGYYCQSSAGLTTVMGTGTAGDTGVSVDEFLEGKDAMVDGAEGACESYAGDLYVSDTLNGKVKRMGFEFGFVETLDFSVSSISITMPTKILCGLSDTSRDLIWILDPSVGQLVQFDYGTGLGSVVSSFTANLISSFCTDSTGTNVYLVSSTNHVIYQVVSGVLTVYAGSAGSSGYSGDGSASTLALLNTPTDCSIDSISGSISILDSGNYRIREISSAGIISTVAGIDPASVDSSVEAVDILAVDSSMSIDESTDHSESGVSALTEWTPSSLSSLVSTRVSEQLSVLFVFNGGQLVRVSDGQVSVVVGDATPGWRGDGYSTSSLHGARFSSSTGFISAAIRTRSSDTTMSTLYIPDAGNNRVRQLSLSNFEITGAAPSGPLTCPRGTYNPSLKAASVLDCILCPPGYYCSDEGMVIPSGRCSSGYYCLAGSVDASSLECPSGYFCSTLVKSAVDSDPPMSDIYTTMLPTEEVDSETASSIGISSVSANSNSDSAINAADGNSGTSWQSTASSTHTIEFEIDGLGAVVYSIAISGFSASSLTSWSLSGVTGSLTSLTIASGASAPLTSITLDLSSVNPNNLLFKSVIFSINLSSSNTISLSEFSMEGFMSPGPSEPFPCPPMTYQPSSAQSVCIVCPSGRYCDGTSKLTSSTCPSGFYCPESVATPIPCPLGFYSSQQLATSLSDCISCPAGQYCAQPGITTPSGDCSAGYICSGGSWSPSPAADDVNPTTNQTIGSVCPEGYYCPAGSSSATVCAAGTFSNFLGASAASDCSACDPGKYCPVSSAGENFPCDAGYVCTGGASVSSPTDGVTGYRCPAGSYCTEGVLAPIPCAPGTFSDAGLEMCITCQAGYYCPVSGMARTALSSYPCPTGYYCAGGNISPTPCEPGTYQSLTSRTSCTACTAGKYCSSFALTSPSGDCSAGFLCSSGSDTPRPSTGIYDGSTILNGFCPLGYYCASGGKSPTLCPTGSYGDTTGLTTCKMCPPGLYCPTTGIITPTLACSAGYYCSIGSHVATQYVCPAGSYCPAGSSTPLACSIGSYTSSSGASTCQLCPAGKRCIRRSSTPEDCPDGMVCPEGSSTGEFCLDGSYRTSSTTVGVADDLYEDCAVCPAGSYCRGGRILGTCAAGYLCAMGNYYSNPIESIAPFIPSAVSDPTLLTLSDSTSQDWSTASVASKYGGIPCPPGHYCSDGAVAPTLCPNGSVRSDSGGRFYTDCSSCPAGSYCPDDSSVPLVCPVGNYCPVASTSPTNCPITTYQPNTGAVELADCQLCTAGMHCDTAGLELPITECPVGYFCVAGAEDPAPCPPGRYRDTVGADAMTSCFACTAGYYCETSALSSPTAICPAGYSCAAGAARPTACTAGYVCVEGTSTAALCPAGSYCPGPSDTMTTDDFTDALITLSGLPGTYEAISCPENYYCPAGAISATACPAGYRSLSSTDKSSLLSACEACPGGTYQSLAGSSTCLPCEAGYVCVSACSSQWPTALSLDGGYPCPEGSYCPQGTGAEVPCALGTFNDLPRRKIECELCPEGSYTASTGSTTCTACGSSASRTSESDTCTCVGLNRFFESGSSKCICRVGYSFIKEGIDLSLEDGTDDCQIKTVPTCLFGKELDHLGSCVSPSTACDGYSCSDGSASTFNTVSGLCQCFNTISSLVSSNVSYDENESVSSSDANASGISRRIRRLSSFSSASTIEECNFVSNDNNEDDINENDEIFCISKVMLFQPFLSTQTSDDGNTNLNLIFSKKHTNEFISVTLDASSIVKSISLDPRRIRNHMRMATNTSSKELIIQPTTQFIFYSNSIQSNREDSKLSPSGFAIPYGFSDEFVNSNLQLNNSSILSKSNPFPLRRLATLSPVNTTLDASLHGPMALCLPLSSFIIWSLPSDIDTALQYRPIFVRDSLLNTVADFDASPFDELRTKLLAGISVDLLAVQLVTEGTYVFSQYGALANSLLVVTVRDSPSCTTTQPLALNEENLAILGVSFDSRFTQQGPNWIEFGLSVGFAIVLIALASFVAFCLHVLIWRYMEESVVEAIDRKGGGLWARLKFFHRGWLPLTSVKKAEKDGLGGLLTGDIDPRLFVAIYAKFLDHHDSMIEQYRAMERNRFADSLAIVQLAGDAQREILESIKRALSDRGDAHQELEIQRQGIRDLMDQMREKRQGLYNAWAQLQDESAKLDNYLKENEKKKINLMSKKTDNEDSDDDLTDNKNRADLVRVGTAGSFTDEQNKNQKRRRNSDDRKSVVSSSSHSSKISSSKSKQESATLNNIASMRDEAFNQSTLTAEVQLDDLVADLKDNLALAIDDDARAVLLKNFKADVASLKLKVDAETQDILDSLDNQMKEDIQEVKRLEGLLEDSQTNLHKIITDQPVERLQMLDNHKDEIAKLEEDNHLQMHGFHINAANEAANELKSLKEAFKAQFDATDNPEERAKLLENFKKQAEQLAAQLKLEADRQSSDLAARLKSRLQKKKKEQKQSMDDLLSKQAEERLVAEKMLVRASDDLMDHVHEKERHALTSRSKAEMTQALISDRKRLAAEKETKVIDLQAKRDKALLLIPGDDEDARRRILNNFAADMDRLNKDFEAETRIASREIAAQLKDRELARMKRLKRRQEVEEDIKDSVSRQDVDRGALLNKQDEDRIRLMYEAAENDKKNVSTSPEDDMMNIINEAAQALANLSVDFEKEVAVAIAVAQKNGTLSPADREKILIDLQRKYRILREEAIKNEDDKLAALRQNLNGIESVKASDLRQKHLDEIRKLTALHKAALDAIENDTRTVLEKIRAEDKQESIDQIEKDLLREKQLIEGELEKELVQHHQTLLSNEMSAVERKLKDLNNMFSGVQSSQMNEERLRLLKQLSDNEMRLQDSLDKERERQKKDIEERIAKMRGNKKKAVEARGEFEDRKVNFQIFDDGLGKDRHSIKQGLESLEAECDNNADAFDALRLRHFVSQSVGGMSDLSNAITSNATVRKLLIEPVVSDDERQMLLSKWTNDLRNNRADHELERLKQQTEVEKRIAARRERLKNRHRAETEHFDTKLSVAEDLLKRDRALLPTECFQMSGAYDSAQTLAKAILTVHQQELALAHAQEMAKSQEVHAARMNDLKQQLNSELQKAEAEAALEMAHVNAERENKKIQMRNQLENENVLKLDKANTDDEREAILREHQKRLLDLDANIQESADREALLIENRLANRRLRVKRKEEEISNKIEIEKEEQRLQQLREDIQAKTRAEKLAEQESLVRMAADVSADLGGNNSSVVGSVDDSLAEGNTLQSEKVRQLLGRRHDREQKDLLNVHFREVSLAQKKIVDDMTIDHETTLNDIRDRYANLIRNLSAGNDSDSISDRIGELEAQQIEEEKNAYKSFDSDLKEKLAESRSDLEAEQGKEVVNLKRKQIAEVQQALKDMKIAAVSALASNAAALLQKVKIEDENSRVAHINRLKIEKELEAERKLEEVKLKWEAAEKEEEEKRERDRLELEKKQEQQRKKDEEAAEQRALKLAEKRRKEAEEEEKKRRLMQGASEAEVAKLLERFENDEKNYANSINVEKERQMAANDERLKRKKQIQEQKLKEQEERKKARQESIEEAIKAQAALEVEEAQMENIAQDMNVVLGTLNDAKIQAAVGSDDAAQQDIDSLVLDKVHPLWRKIIQMEEEAYKQQVDSELTIQMRMAEDHIASKKGFTSSTQLTSLLLIQLKTICSKLDKLEKNN